MSILGGGEQPILGELRNLVESELRRLGLLYQIFGRIKSERSIEEKIARKGYGGAGGRVRDIFGLRVAVYFADDMEYVSRVSERLFNRVESTIDLPGADVFGPVRYNMIFRLPDWAIRGCGIKWEDGLIDPTFEIQARTILSEGWHEVEHDLRYKAKEDWSTSEDLSRTLNGILATVETCEWGMRQIFEELAWRHYKAKRWDAMLRSKFRLRFTSPKLSSEVFECIQREPRLQRSLYRFPRAELLDKILESGPTFPVTLDNICFALNRLGEFSAHLRSLEPVFFQILMRSNRFTDFPTKAQPASGP